MAEVRIEIQGIEPVILFGPYDSLLKKIRAEFSDIQITARGNQIILRGGTEEVALLERIFNEMIPDFCQLVRKLRVQELNKCAVRQFAGVHAHGVYFSGSLIMDICLLHLPQFVPNLP